MTFKYLSGSERNIDFDAIPNSIPFTQFLRPNGRMVAQWIEIDEHTAPLTLDHVHAARAIVEAGYQFEMEMLTTGHVSFTIANNDTDLVMRLSVNGLPILKSIADMIEEGTVETLNKRTTAWKKMMEEDN